MSSQTYRDLEGYLDEQNAEGGVWPEVLMWEYPTGRGADVAAWRIRKGRVDTPGDGAWEARVERVEYGNTNGPCRVYVRYVP